MKISTCFRSRSSGMEFVPQMMQAARRLTKVPQVPELDEQRQRREATLAHGTTACALPTQPMRQRIMYYH
ncbi:MAG: hypothetical protein V4636_07020 [Pseudomonadota bacterium]